MSSFTLKLFGIFFMLVDHVGLSFFPDLISFRLIGRLAFPIFAFQIANGFEYTKNKVNYIVRMLIFAIVSQIPFVFFLNSVNITSVKTNIGFTFFLSLLCLYIIDTTKKSKKWWQLILIFPLLVAGSLLCVDYKIYGILTVILFYLLKNKKYFFHLISMFIVLNILFINDFSVVQIYSVFAFIFLSFYNNKKGPNSKYLFYAFYPIHLLLLGIISYCII